jgi:hypothetical protein
MGSDNNGAAGGGAIDGLGIFGAVGRPVSTSRVRRCPARPSPPSRRVATTGL